MQTRVTKNKQAEMKPKSVESLRREIATRGRKLEEGRRGKRKKLPIWSILFVTVSITNRRLTSQTLKTQKTMMCTATFKNTYKNV